MKPLVNGLHFNNLRGDLYGGLTAAVVSRTGVRSQYFLIYRLLRDFKGQTTVFLCDRLTH
jgi:hypothetical protein